MTCPTCHAPAAITWRSTAAGLAVEGCADCHRRWRRQVLTGIVEADPDARAFVRRAAAEARRAS